MAAPFAPGVTVTSGSSESDFFRYSPVTGSSKLASSVPTKEKVTFSFKKSLDKKPRR